VYVCHRKQMATFRQYFLLNIEYFSRGAPHSNIPLRFASELLSVTHRHTTECHALPYLGTPVLHPYSVCRLCVCGVSPPRSVVCMYVVCVCVCVCVCLCLCVCVSVSVWVLTRVCERENEYNSYTWVGVHTHRGQAMTTSSRSGLFLCRLEDQVLSRLGNSKCDGRIGSHSSSHT